MVISVCLSGWMSYQEPFDRFASYFELESRQNQTNILSSWFKISKLSELNFVEKMLVSRQSQVAKLVHYKLEIFSTLLSNMSVFCYFLILYLFLKLIRIAKCLKLAKSLLWSNNLPSWYIYIYNLMHLETSRKKFPVLKITYCT